MNSDGSMLTLSAAQMQGLDLGNKSSHAKEAQLTASAMLYPQLNPW